MSIHDAVKEVASFADADSPTVQFAHVVFHAGEVWAQGHRGGALAKTQGIEKISLGVPAKKLLKALQAVGDDPQMEVADNNRLVLTGEGATAKIEGMRVKDMPVFHRPPAEAEWLLVPRCERISEVSWCVGKDVTRRHLSGVHFSPEGRVEATDGHACASLDLGVSGLPDMLVTPDMVQGLSGDRWIAAYKGRVFIAAEKGGGSGFRAGNLIEAQFPPLSQLVKGALDQGNFLVGRQDMVSLLKKAKLSNYEVTLLVNKRRIEVEVDGERAQSLFSFASGVAFQEGNRPVPEGRIGFNANLLLPMFQMATSDQVRVFVTPSQDQQGGLDPLVMEDGTCLGVAMPYRL